MDRTPDTPLPRVYLAGDLVFRPGALALYDRLRSLCRSLGLRGIAPLDGQAAIQGMPPGEATIMAIVAADRDLMDGCDAGLFCLDPFRRAPDMDPGTAVEIGYMFAQGKPLSGYTADGRPYPMKVESYFHQAWDSPLQDRPGAELGGASGSKDDPDGILVHSEGLLQNGMTEGFIRLSGGQVFHHPDLFEAAGQAAADLARRLHAKGHPA